MPTRSRRGGVPTAAFLVTIVIALVAFFLPGWWGAVPLLAGAAYLGHLLNQRWRALPPAVAFLRALMITFLIVFALIKVL